MSSRGNTQKLREEIRAWLESDGRHRGPHNDRCGDTNDIFGCDAMASIDNRLVDCTYCNLTACMASEEDCSGLSLPSSRQQVKGPYACPACIQAAEQALPYEDIPVPAGQPHLPENLPYPKIPPIPSVLHPPLSLLRSAADWSGVMMAILREAMEAIGERNTFVVAYVFVGANRHDMASTIKLKFEFQY